MNILFIHRSVGHHILERGHLRSLLKDTVQLNDYDNNNGLLTQSDGSQESDAIAMPGNNTNPDNLAQFFAEWPDILNQYDNQYDAIMIKSCYPNSHIQNDAALQRVQAHYKSIFASFEKHTKPLIILTTPPLRPLFTNNQEAMLASKLAEWLVSSADRKKHRHVFDFHDGLAEDSGRHKGMLKRNYRRLAPWDNHPNNTAHRHITPQLAAFINSFAADE